MPIKGNPFLKQDNQTKLKPCPFCGGEGEITKSFLYGKVCGYMASCKKCGCQLSMYTSKQNAEKAWNRRANNDR